MNNEDAHVLKHRGPDWSSAKVISFFGSLTAILLWLLGLTYTTGERARQLDANTIAIADIQENGSRGTKARLDGIETSINDLRSQQKMLTEEIFNMLHVTEERHK